MKLHFVFYFCILLALAGCESRFVDISGQQQPMSFELPGKNPYLSFAWISEDKIVFNYDVLLGVQKPSEITFPEFHVYDLKKQEWEKIIIGEGECDWRLRIVHIQRLPNGNIGYWRTCTENGYDSEKRQEMNIESGKITDIDIEPIGAPGRISYSPDMAEFIQQDEAGHPLNGKLFYRNGSVTTQLVPDFFRAMYPQWSPHRREVLFFGLEKDPSKDNNSGPIWQTLLFAPNNLYIATPEGKDVKKILSDIEGGSAKWSPKENIFAFSGKYSGTEGIWLVNPDTLKMIRVWNKSEKFDWSPDGDKMLIVETKYGSDFMITSQKPLIISIGALP